MTLRYFYQRSVNINLKFGILIFVIALTARLIKCDEEATEAPAGGGDEATEGGTGEPEEHDHEPIKGVACEEFTKQNDKSCEIVGDAIVNHNHTHCIISDEDAKVVCALIQRCPGLDKIMQDIYKYSVYEDSEHVMHLRNESLSCSGHQEGGNGQMLSSSLWLIFGVVGGLMIFLRYD